MNNKHKGIGIFVTMILVFLAVGTLVSVAEKVDLFFLVDGSNSITPENYTLQLEGYAEAISDSSVIPQTGTISVCVIMFGYFPPCYTKVEVPLTTITNQTDADSIAQTILSMPQPNDHTPMADAFTLANSTLTGYIASGITSPDVRQIIDIATDGRPNKIRDVSGQPYQKAVNATYEARDDAVTKGYFDEVNVLGVDVIEEVNPPAQPYNRDFLHNLTYPQPWWNESGFYMEATNYTDFQSKIKEKIKREVHVIPANVTIKPETLNLASKGEFTVFITLPEVYNIINISTVVCEGAPAVKGMIADNNKYIVKFDREDLRENLPTGDEVLMTVTGKVFYNEGYADFEGSDTIRVLNEGKGK
jgi:hypothetical protein